LAVLTAVSFIVENIRQETQETMLKNYMQRIDSENRYRAAYEKLKETQSQLIQSGKLASIGELASGVAHELNQPLTVIRGNVQLMQKMRHHERPHSAAEVTSLDLIERNTERMMTIINHLRSFTRQSPSEKISLKINDVIEDAFLMITEQLRIHDIDIKKNLCGHLPDMRGNPIQMEQVILNLITNARDAIQEKRTHRANGQPASAGAKDIIEISTRLADKDGQKTEILIKDTGAGIPAEHVGKIFDPFFTTKEIGKGTGLGLSISYGIIRNHGGEIDVLETGPEGTTIRVALTAD
jgi:histidine kinase